MTILFDRSYVLAACILAVAALIVVFLLQDLNDSLPDLPRFEPAAVPAVLGPTNGRLPELFAPATMADAARVTNEPLPFITTFFQPPPPPRTHKVRLTYSGYFETANGEKRAYLVVGDKSVMFQPGAKVVGDVMISNILRAELTLQQATQAVVIPFRGSKEVEVPVE